MGRALVVLLVTLLLTGCPGMVVNRFIFFPDVGGAPAPAGVLDQWLTTSDGVRIHALVSIPSATAPVLLWSHGNAGNISQRVDVLQAFNTLGLGVLAYDYRGYGRSEGKPSEEGVYLDALAAYDALLARGVTPERIILFGESLGGGVTLQLATVRPCAGVAVTSTFTRIKDAGRHHFGPLAHVVGNRFDSLSRVKTLRVPLFLAHGDADEVIPFELGQALFDAAPQPKTFLRLPGVTHNTALSSPALLHAVAEFANANAR